MPGNVARLAVAGLLLLGGGGCEQVPGTEAFATRAAEARAAALLIDPASAQFTEVRTFGRQNERVCGMINGRNRMGAYAGASRFVSTPSFVAIEPTEDSAYTQACMFEAATAFYCADKLGPAIEASKC